MSLTKTVEGSSITYNLASRQHATGKGSSISLDKIDKMAAKNELTWLF